MNDPVERQAVLDEIQKCTEVYVNNLPIMIDKAELQTKIMLMPSVQSEIIRCKDCKWKDQHNCTRAVEVFIDDNKYCAWAERRRTDDKSD